MADTKAMEHLAEAAELTRRQTSRATSGWLRIIVIGCVLLLVTLFVVQKGTGLPVYDVIGMGSCEGDQTQCDEVRKKYSSGQINIARLAVIVVVIGVCFYLYSVFEGGPSAVLGQTAAPGLDLRTEVQATNQTSSTFVQQALSSTQGKAVAEGTTMALGTTGAVRGAETVGQGGAGGGGGSFQPQTGGGGSSQPMSQEAVVRHITNQVDLALK